jgi:chromosome segregation ATPase
MSNLINLTARLRSLSAELIDAEHEEGDASRYLETMRELGDEMSISMAQTRYEDACKQVDEIEQAIADIEDEMEELSNAHDERDEDF